MEGFFWNVGGFCLLLIFMGLTAMVISICIEMIMAGFRTAFPKKPKRTLIASGPLIRMVCTDSEDIKHVFFRIDDKVFFVAKIPKDFPIQVGKTYEVFEVDSKKG